MCSPLADGVFKNTTDTSTLILLIQTIPRLEKYTVTLQPRTTQSVKWLATGRMTIESAPTQTPIEFVPGAKRSEQEADYSHLI
jgi:hypothetical protein